MDNATKTLRLPQCMKRFHDASLQPVSFAASENVMPCLQKGYRVQVQSVLGRSGTYFARPFMITQKSDDYHIILILKDWRLHPVVSLVHIGNDTLNPLALDLKEKSPDPFLPRTILRVKAKATDKRPRHIKLGKRKDMC
ncbi:hypothetical protein V6Z77_005296 [Aspergillus fumigatus]